MLPFTTLDLAAAGKNQGALQTLALAGLGRLAVVSNAGVDGSQEDFIGCRVIDSACHGTAVLDEPDRNTKLWDPLDEFASPIERIDDPNPRTLQADRVVDTLFRKPTLAIEQQFLAENGVEGAICLGYGIVSGFIFGFDRSRREAAEDRARGLQRGVNALHYSR